MNVDFRAFRRHEALLKANEAETEFGLAELHEGDAKRAEKIEAALGIKSTKLDSPEQAREKAKACRARAAAILEEANRLEREGSCS